MTKMFCDRCGAEIDQRAAPLLTKRTVYVRYRLFSAELHEDWKDDDKYLCIECAKQYINWFMGTKEASNAD